MTPSTRISQLGEGDQRLFRVLRGNHVDSVAVITGCSDCVFSRSILRGVSPVGSIVRDSSETERPEVIRVECEHIFDVALGSEYTTHLISD
jgi:hypothetical protein